MGSRNGVSTEKIRALGDDTRRDVDDELFGRARRHDDDDTIVELTMIIAWENASSRFNRASRIPSQGFWKP